MARSFTTVQSDPPKNLPHQTSLGNLLMIVTPKEVIDVAAASTAALSLAAWLPPVASLFTIVWLGIRIWETDTIKKLTYRDD
jgi:hypothetical protein|tara:strand:+ start:70 stop:315 length:246 start_codon:yes stop_codon:yes gene_type:complete